MFPVLLFPLLPPGAAPKKAHGVRYFPLSLEGGDLL
jgi:hypothetical protein